MTYVVSLVDPCLAYFHEQGLARASMTAEDKTGYVMSDFKQLDDRMHSQGLPKLILCDFVFLGQLENAASKDKALQQVPVVVFYGGHHDGVPATSLNHIHTADVPKQNPRDICHIIEAFDAARDRVHMTVTPAAFEAALKLTPVSPGGTRAARSIRLIHGQPQT